VIGGIEPGALVDNDWRMKYLSHMAVAVRAMYVHPGFVHLQLLVENLSTIFAIILINWHKSALLIKPFALHTSCRENSGN
jgi:hypothetical protein